MTNPDAVLKPENPIIVIDDEPNSLQSVDLVLRIAGFNNIKTFTSANEAISVWKANRCSAVILDVVMPDANGLDVLKEIKSTVPEVPVIMVTGVNEIDSAVTCLKNGAHDYLIKPIESERLIVSLTNALYIAELEKDYTRLSECMLSEKPNNPDSFNHIITRSECMLRLFKYVESVGPTGHPVLITGETGVGKELFAKAIHKVSIRQGDFVTVNIAGLDDAMFSDTLFGHVKGAFTGADSARPGLIEQAFGGTIFLDEIGDLSVQSQIKLLRLIQEKEYRQLGKDAILPCNARIVAATCRTLEDLNESTIFRKDLFYRLRTHHVHIPPLRERKDDLALLTAFFVEKAAKELNRNKPFIPLELYDILNAYHFPGNFRELNAIIFDAMSNSHNGKLSLQSIHQAIGTHQIKTSSESSVTFNAQLPSLKEVEHILIREAVARASGNQTVAAELLGITRQTLAYRLKQLS